MQITLSINTEDTADIESALHVLTALQGKHVGEAFANAHMGGDYKLRVADRDRARELAEKAMRKVIQGDNTIKNESARDLAENAVAEAIAQKDFHVTGVEGVSAGPEGVRNYASLFDEVPAPAPTVPKMAENPRCTVGTEIDAAGTPWDERIHASTKTKVADGTWKKKRGVDPAVYDDVMEEISDSSKKPVAPPAIVPVPAAPSAGGTAPTPPPPPPPVVEAINYQGLLARVMNSGGLITPAMLGAACKAEGVESFPALHNHPDKVPAVARRLGLV